MSGLNCRWAGGARVWLVGRVVCARAPSLTSVRDPGWLRAGDMMFDGVIALGEARLRHTYQTTHSPVHIENPCHLTKRRRAKSTRRARVYEAKVVWSVRLRQPC